MKRYYIGFSGRAEVGKTTLALALATELRRLGIEAAIHPFAAPVKRIAYSMFWNGKKDAKGRRLLQLLGTECGRKCIDPNIWVDLWERATPAFGNTDGAGVVIADDVRFDNELAAIHRLGGTVIEVRRKSRLPWWRRVFRRVHASERGVKADAVYANYGTEADLKAFAKRLADEIAERL